MVVRLQIDKVLLVVQYRLAPFCVVERAQVAPVLGRQQILRDVLVQRAQRTAVQVYLRDGRTEVVSFFCFWRAFKRSADEKGYLPAVGSYPSGMVSARPVLHRSRTVRAARGML